MSIAAIHLKRGDTFSFAGLLPVGALSTGAWAARCAIVARLGGFKFDIAATLTAPVAPDTQYHLALYAPKSVTAGWAPGKYSGDVEFSDSTATPEPFTITSKTFQLTVEADLTTP